MKMRMSKPINPMMNKFVAFEKRPEHWGYTCAGAGVALVVQGWVPTLGAAAFAVAGCVLTHSMWVRLQNLKAEHPELFVNLDNSLAAMKESKKEKQA